MDATGLTGPVSAANSLVGTTAGDIGRRPRRHGADQRQLRRRQHRSGTTAEPTMPARSTWGSGTTGISGPSRRRTASSARPRTTGRRQRRDGSDQRQLRRRQHHWNNGAADRRRRGRRGATAPPGITGAVIGRQQPRRHDRRRRRRRRGVTALTNGNYVVHSSVWDNGTACRRRRGRPGATAPPASTGAVSAANSLVGTTAGDHVGVGGVTALTNGNYVVSSRNWDNGAVGRRRRGDLGQRHHRRHRRRHRRQQPRRHAPPTTRSAQTA